MHTLAIEKMTYGIDALTRLDGKVLFVPYAAPGDTAEIEVTETKSDYLRGRVSKIVTPSDARRESPCPNFPTGQAAYADLLDSAAAVPGVKRTLVGSGLRLDLAALDPAFVRRLARGHVGGHLKVAPEHFSDRVLRLMRTPAGRRS